MIRAINTGLLSRLCSELVGEPVTVRMDVQCEPDALKALGVAEWHGDGWRIVLDYGSRLLDGTRPSELLYVLCHECGHIKLGHVPRREIPKAAAVWTRAELDAKTTGLSAAAREQIARDRDRREQEADDWARVKAAELEAHCRRYQKCSFFDWCTREL